MVDDTICSAINIPSSMIFDNVDGIYKLELFFETVSKKMPLWVWLSLFHLKKKTLLEYSKQRFFQDSGIPSYLTFRSPVKETYGYANQCWKNQHCGDYSGYDQNEVKHLSSP